MTKLADHTPPSKSINRVLDIVCLRGSDRNSGWEVDGRNSFVCEDKRGVDSEAAGSGDGGRAACGGA